MFMRILATFLAAIVIVAVASVGTVSAANGAAPGDLLYGVDRGVENLRQSLAFTPEARIQIQLEAAQERLEEIQVLTRRGNTEHIAEALVDFQRSLDEATLIASTATGSEPQLMSDALDIALDEDPTVPGDDGGEGEGEDGEDENFYCTGAQPHPVGTKLAQRYEVTYEEIMGWFCSGYGFGEIQLAYDLSQRTDYTVEDLFGMRQQGLGWGEVMQAAGVIGRGKGKMKQPPTGEETATPEPEDEGEEDGDTGDMDGPRCSNDKIHPHGQTLANKFGVPYEEIMGWFCSGYGFGEIKLAYGISREKGVSVEEVFAKRASGMGWGEIMKEYDLKGNPDKGPKNDKDKDKDKGKDKNKKPKGKP